MSTMGGRSGTPIPMMWVSSSTRGFVEVPVAHDRLRSIDVQVVVRPDGRRGLVSVLYLNSGELEVYHQPSLDLDYEWFENDPPFAHCDLKELVPTAFETIECTVAPDHVSAALDFTDVTGQRIELRLDLPDPKAVKPLFTPAPVHRAPRSLRFLQMNQFRLMPARQTEVEVRIGGTPVEARPFVSPTSRLTPYLQARSGGDFLQVGMNPQHSNRLLEVANGMGAVDLADGSTAVIDSRGLRSLRTEGNGAWFEAVFEPALPNPDRLLEHGNAERGRIEVLSSLGPVAQGQWSSWPLGATGVVLEFNGLTQDWSPGLTQPARTGLRYLRNYRRRGLSWNYRAGLSRDADGWRSSGAWSTA
ncbi:MAG: hypothetical protein AAF467_09405 [Actinomycetota bacterium]